MIAISNHSTENATDHGEGVDLPSRATQELDVFFDCLVQILGGDLGEEAEISASFVVSNSDHHSSPPMDVVASDPPLENTVTTSPAPTVPTELLELLEPDRTDVETTQAMAGLREFLAGGSAVSANDRQLAHLHQLNTQLSERLLQLEEQLNISHCQQLNRQLSERVAQLEEKLSASHQKNDQLVSEISQLLTLHATETRSKKQYKQRCFALGLTVCVLLGGLGIGTLTPDRPPSDQQITLEIERTLLILNQIDGMALSAKVHQGNLTLAGTAHPMLELEYIAQTFSQIPGVKSVTNTVKLEPIPIGIRLYFDVNSATVASQDLDGKLRQIKQVMQQYPQLQLKIIGHAHPTEATGNKSNLALERSQAVQTILEDIGIDRRRTLALSRPGSPPDVAPNQPSWLSQCVLFETEVSDQ